MHSRPSLFLIAALLCVISPAQAHVTIQPTPAHAGSVYTAAFRVGHACAGAQATQRLAVTLPEGFTLVDAEPRIGWSLTQQAHLVVWQADTDAAAVPNHEKTTFVLQGRLPDAPGTLWFKVTQGCDQGEARWDQIPSNQADAPKPAYPAARLEVLPKE